MKQLITAFVTVASLYAFVPAAAAEDHTSSVPLETRGDGKAKKKLSDSQIRQILIDESIEAYSGNCPCPYSRASNGSRCGRRSAYSREGGEAPLCYPKDVSAQMVQEYRDTHPDE